VSPNRGVVALVLLEFEVVVVGQLDGSMLSCALQLLSRREVSLVRLLTVQCVLVFVQPESAFVAVDLV
jgi:hypothetical protein